MNMKTHYCRFHLCLLLIDICLLAVVPCSAQDTTGTGTLKGALLAESSHAPVSYSRVCLLQVEPRCATTDADGRFIIIGLRPGSHEVQIQVAPGAVPVKTWVDVRAGVDLVVEFLVPDSTKLSETVEVTAPAAEIPQEIKSSGYLISGHEVQQDPSALTDVARFVQNMPGVSFGGDDFRNDIVVRGGSPLENLYVIDNVEIPSLSHFSNFGSAGGAIGLTNSNLLSDVTFLTGGYPAPYSNRLSSVLQITQREGSRERLRSQVTVGMGGAGAIAEGPVSKNGSWLFSFRRSFLDAFGTDTEGGGTPVYSNFQAKVVYDLGANDRVWVVSVGGWDTMRERPNPTKQKYETEVTNVDWRGFRMGSGLNWQHLFGDHGTGLLGLTFSRGKVDNTDRDVRLNNAVIARQDSVEDEYAAKYDLSLAIPVLQKLQLGGNARWMRTDYLFDKPLGLENPFSPDLGRVDPLHMRDASVTTLPSAYLQITRSVGRRLSLTAGGRFDRYTILDSSRYSPRAGLSYQLTQRISFHASYGTYWQQPFMLYIKANPINRMLQPMRAEHYVAGFTMIGSGWTASIEAYEKRYRQYPVSIEYPQVSLASAGDSYDPAIYMIPLTSAGKGRARGVEFYLRKNLTERLYGQASFAVASSRNSALDGIYRPGGFDSRYLFNASGGYLFGKKWQLGARYIFLSGRPYTPFNVEISQEQNRPIFDLSRVNALRSASYQRLDFRVDRTFKVWNGTLNAYLGLQNAFNRENSFAYTWNYRLDRPKRLTLAPLFPLCGMEWRF